MTTPNIETEPTLTLPELRAALRAYLADGAARTEVRAIAEAGMSSFDRDRWRAMSEALGVGALLVGPEYGGLGLDLRYACAAAEVAGEALCPAPVRSTLLAARVLSDAVAASPAEHPATRWLNDIAALAASAGVAVDLGAEGGGVYLDGAVDDQASGSCTVTGRLAIVENGSVDLLVLWARDRQSTDGGAMVGVDLTGESAITRHRCSGTDTVGDFASIQFDRCPAVRLGDRAAFERATVHALVLRAAEQVGLARGALAMATDHARQREQFGRIIGTYQAVSHRLAQNAVDIEGAAGLVGTAAVTCVGIGDHDRASLLAPLAAATAARVSSAAADTLIQVLGGIGFTWEHDAQFWFRRIKSLSVWMGSADALDDMAARRHCHRLLSA